MQDDLNNNAIGPSKGLICLKETSIVKKAWMGLLC